MECSRGIWIGYLGITVAFIAQYVRFRSESIKLHGAILMILTLGCGRCMEMYRSGNIVDSVEWILVYFVESNE